MKPHPVHFWQQAYWALLVYNIYRFKPQRQVLVSWVQILLEIMPAIRSKLALCHVTEERTWGQTVVGHVDQVDVRDSSSDHDVGNQGAKKDALVGPDWSQSVSRAKKRCSSKIGSRRRAAGSKGTKVCLFCFLQRSGVCSHLFKANVSAASKHQALEIGLQ